MDRCCPETMRGMTMMRALVVIAAVMAAAAVAGAEERGTLGKDDFVTSSIDAVFDKVNKITSGEEKIIDRKLMETGEESGRGEDALDRKLSGSVVIRTGKTTPGAQAAAAAAPAAAAAAEEAAKK